MRKPLALILLLLTAACSSFTPGGAQERGVGLVLLPRSGGMDLLNARTGAVVKHLPNSLMSDGADFAGEQRDIFIRQLLDKKEHVIDSSGRDVLDPPATPWRPYYDGLAVTWGGGLKSSGTPCGYVDADYKLVIPMQFTDCQDFAEGLASVRVKGDVGFIDKTGKLVVPPQYRAGDGFSEGLAAVQDRATEKCGYIDRAGKVVIPFQFREADDFHNGVAIVYDKAIDKAGKILPYTSTPFSEERAIRADGKLIDPQGNEIGGSPVAALRGDYGFLQSQGSRNLSVFQQGLMRVSTKDGVALVDRAGKLVTDKRRWIDPVAPGFWVAFNEDWTTELLGRDGQTLKTPSRDCRPVDSEMNLVGDVIDRFGVLICPVKEFAPEERRRRGRFRPMPKMGVPMHYYSVYGWRSAEFTY